MILDKLRVAKRHVDSCVEMFNDERNNHIPVNMIKLNDEIVLAQVEINRALFEECSYTWHPAHENPKEDGYYLTYCENGYIVRKFSVDTFSGKRTFLDIYGHSVFENQREAMHPTHWMRLPEWPVTE